MEAVVAGNRIVLQPENESRWFLHLKMCRRSAGNESLNERSFLVLPCFVDKQNSLKRLMLLAQPCPNDRQVYP